MLWRGLTQVTHIKLPLLFQTTTHAAVSYRLLRFLLISSLPQLPPLSVSIYHSFQIRCGFLEYILVYSTPPVLFHDCC
ncbi:unnamed protein product [Hymenolepis diminuta]|uniref:Uncharacterized protein n=1 Tax=Hymenolepis diminuta TaxID=6216 RepID=A0A564YUG4_HYMDI|nr:unnamed protein product [Hymenolepis diminuta]